MKKAVCLALVFSTMFLCSYSNASDIQDLDPTQPLNQRASTRNVMGMHHTHPKNEFMISYRSTFMKMKGNRSGTSQLNNSQVLATFPVTPTDMSMVMHMLGLMYTPTDNLTLMLMLPVIQKNMNHLTGTGVRFKTKASGIGDIKFGGMFNLFQKNIHKIHFMGMIGLPSGSIDKKDDLPTGPNQQLPYPMQIGSGTVDLTPGLTYLTNGNLFSWGADINTTLRLGRNNNHYSLGDRLHFKQWLTYSPIDPLSFSIVVHTQLWGNIDGADPRLNPIIVPTANPRLRGGERIDLLPGISYYFTDGVLKNLRVSVSGGIPIYQSLDGPQLETDWSFNGGLEYLFNFK